MTKQPDTPPSDNQPRFCEGDLVETTFGDVGIIIGPYPVFELGIVDFYVKINDEIEIHRVQTLKHARL
jgi:hypothetical protein